MDQFITSSGLEELCIREKGRTGRKRLEKDRNGSSFKSKNLHAERRRREKLNDKLLALRGLVPNITNMKKATIVDDAVTYIKQLQQTVDNLQDQLLGIEASSPEGTELKKEEITAEEEEHWIQPDITVTQLHENKLWIKVIFKKKPGGFTKLMEVLSDLGFELTDTSLTTHNGLLLVTLCLQGFSRELLTVEEIKEVLLKMVN
ncbi:Basic helix-loop-helix transcription factor [Parasponia andersonii]|uniref:Basic helix-loop-helix transcription factor n=1 Tax=Parasponia andersonii TaxID=3476 RepID=A0A2P5AH37_PARAD|nr:Basic helix-loop-helix transcription factor [Parasponia andersonii]